MKAILIEWNGKRHNIEIADAENALTEASKFGCIVYRIREGEPIRVFKYNDKPMLRGSRHFFTEVKFLYTDNLDKNL